MLFGWTRDIPCLNNSGFSAMTQWPASISTNRKRGKKRPMMGIASSGIYGLWVPRTNRAGFSKRTSSGLVYGKSPRWPREAPNVFKENLNLCVFSFAGRCRFPRRNCLITRDCVTVSSWKGQTNPWFDDTFLFVVL